MAIPRGRRPAQILNVFDVSGAEVSPKGALMINTRAGLMALMLATSFAYAGHASADTPAAASASTGTGMRTVADDEVTNERIQSAGRAAHLGRELCGATSASMMRFKESLRHKLDSPADFDAAWDYGWARANAVLLQFQSLKSTDPQDYQHRVRLICATLRRAAQRVENSAASAPSAQH